ncbi:MAG TPA: hypothetical protein IAB55_03895 [Candidatus Merdivicinus faecavium]|nr:hypothetical protein [Candidatus Merdivicinus faecavium]
MAFLKRAALLGHAAVPLLLSAFAAAQKSVLLGCAAAASLFLMVKIMPVWRRRESLGVFLLTALAGVPLNLYGAVQFARFALTEEEFFALSLLRGAVCFVVLLCAEEILLGLIARLLWRKQLPISFE